MANTGKTTTIRKSNGEIAKIQKLETSKRQAGPEYQNMDYYEEQLYRMEKQELKNLDQLDNHKDLTRKSESIQIPNFLQRSSTSDSKSEPEP